MVRRRRFYHSLTAAFLIWTAVSTSSHADDVKNDEPTPGTGQTLDDTIIQLAPPLAGTPDNEIITNSTIIDQSSIKTLKLDWRDKFGVLTIGYLIDGGRERQRRRLEPFRLALQRKSGLQVVMRPARTLDELIKLQIDRRIQYALHSASSYVQIQSICKCVEPLVVPSDKAGATGIHAVIIAPLSGKVRRLTDLKGNRLAVPAPPSIITRMLPLKNLKNAGYDAPGDLGELINVANPIEGWRKTLNNEADAIIGWSSLAGNFQEGYSQGTLKHLIETTELAKSTDLRVIWQSEQIPNAPHVIRRDIPVELKELLRGFLTELNQKNRPAFDSISPELAGSFILIDDKAFQPLHDIAATFKETRHP